VPFAFVFRRHPERSEGSLFARITDSQRMRHPEVIGAIVWVVWKDRPRTPLLLLPLEPHSKAPRTFAECILATLENIAHLLPNIRVFQATSVIGNRR
jgi:hypothetical protein